MPYARIANSTVLDAFAANQYTAAQYAAIQVDDRSRNDVIKDLFAFGTKKATIDTNQQDITAGLVLKRVEDPTELLNKSWGER